MIGQILLLLAELLGFSIFYYMICLLNDKKPRLKDYATVWGKVLLVEGIFYILKQILA